MTSDQTTTAPVRAQWFVFWVGGRGREGLLFAAVVAAAAGGIAGRARISAGTLTTAAALGATIRSALAA